MEQANLEEEPRWSKLQRLGFLFAGIYIFLYIFPLHNIGFRIGFYDSLIEMLVLWVGKSILHIPHLAKIEMTGSGDTTFDYVRVFTFFLIAVAGSFIIFALDSNRRNYSKLFYWFSVYLRYYIGLTMLSYGLVKVFKTQFPFPGLGRLEQPYGNSSPMGLLWTFMGYSNGYNIFAGTGEIVAGLLLLFRRTIPLGAILTIVVMSNVAAMNFFYDVPVKILSSSIVLFALFLLGPYVKGLWNFFILRKSTQLTGFRYPVMGKGGNITRYILKSVFFMYCLLVVTQCWSMLQYYGDNAPKSAIDGVYKTEVFVKNKDTMPSGSTDTLQWKKVILETWAAKIICQEDKFSRWRVETDTVNHKLFLTARYDTSTHYNLNYKKSGDELTLSGLWGKSFITARLKKQPISNYSLVNRGFHWINEYPPNW